MKAKPGGDQRLLSVPSVLCQTEEVREDSIRVPSASGADLSSYSTNVKQSEFVWEPSEPVFCLSISTIRRRRVHQLLGLETPQSVIYHLHHQSWLLSELVICKTQTRKNKPEMFSQRLTHGGVGLSAAGQPRWLPRGTTALTMVTVTVCPACEASSPPWCRSISVSSPWTTNLLGVKYSSKAEHVCTAAVRKSARSGNTCITFRFRCGAL